MSAFPQVAADVDTEAYRIIASVGICWMWHFLCVCNGYRMLCIAEERLFLVTLPMFLMVVLNNQNNAKSCNQVAILMRSGELQRDTTQSNLLINVIKSLPNYSWNTSWHIPQLQERCTCRIQFEWHKGFRALCYGIQN